MEQHATDSIDFDKGGGIVTAIAQDYASGRVLMVAYMNREALAETIRSGRACYFSRSRGKLWRKGEESGNFQSVREIRTDCDGDAILILVEQQGDRAACHEGYESCFFRALNDGDWRTVDGRVVDPAKYGPSYGHAPRKS